MHSKEPSGLLSRSLLLLLLLTFRAHSQTASIDALGSPGQSTAAAAVSDDGKVVVGWRRSAGATEAFVWREGAGGQRLNLPGETLVSSARSVSGDGRIIVGSFSDSTGRSIPLRWVDSQPELLPLPAGDEFSGFPAKISRDGKNVVGAVGPANVEDRSGWKICRWHETGHPELIETSPAQSGFVDPTRLAVSPDGSVITLALFRQPQVYRWSADVGFVQLKLEPAAHEFSYPGDWHLAMAGDGSVLGTARFQKKIFKWSGLGAGVPLPITLTTNPASQLVVNDRGSLFAGMTANHLFGASWSTLVVPPFGPLGFEAVLRGQGCNLSVWNSLTNISAMSADGQWVVGLGSVAPIGDLPGRVDAYRAKLVLHGDGSPQLSVEVLNPDSDSSVHRLRWPATDLLVTVESTPMLHPNVPWVAESGTPRIEGNEIVLDLEKVTESRYFRLRRVD